MLSARLCEDSENQKKHSKQPNVWNFRVNKHPVSLGMIFEIQFHGWCPRASLLCMQGEA